MSEFAFAGAVEFLSGLYLPCADAVFVEVVGVHSFDVESGIGVVFPAAAEVYHIVYAAYLVVTRESQAEGVVFAVGSIGYLDVAQHGSVECAGGAETVDAEGVVAAVLGSPLLVVDYAGGYCVEVDVGELVCAYYHTGVAVVERLNHFCEGVLVGVDIVAVELYAEFACFGVHGAYVPAAADAEVVALGYAGRKQIHR